MDALTFYKEHCSLFAGVPETNLDALAVASSLLNPKKGQTVLFQGSTVDALHVICMGSVGILIKTPKGTVQVAELGPGEVFGEASIFEMGTAKATVKSLADDTYILAIPQEAFRTLLASDPAFVARVKGLIAERSKPSGPPPAGS